MSIPAVLGAVVLDVADAIAEGIDPALLGVYAVGILSSAVSGYLSIRFINMIASKGKFGAFAYYCWAAGLITLILTFVL